MGLFLGSNLVSPAELVGNGSSVDIDDITITENSQGKIQSVGVKNQNEASGATNPLKLWEGTKQEWEQGGGSQTWYAWKYNDTTFYTIEADPTTESIVYWLPNTTSSLTITSVGTGTITLSDTNVYAYDSAGNQTTYQTIGKAYPRYLCFIDGTGLKIGDNDIANIAPDGTLINYGTKINTIAIGKSTDTIRGHAQATSARAIAIGGLSEASGMNSIAIGNQAKATAEGAIQIGSWGTASERGLFVGLSSYSNYKLLASNGKIPNDRIDGVSGSFTTADNKTVTVTNGIITAITPNE